MNFAPRAAVDQAKVELAAAVKRNDDQARMQALTKIALGKSEFDESEQALVQIDEALALSKALRSPGDQCRLLLIKAYALSDLQRFEEAEALQAQAMAIASEAHLDKWKPRIELGMAWLDFSRGRIATATSRFAVAYQHAEASNDAWAMSDSLNGMGNIAARPQATPQERQRGVKLFRQALALVDENTFRSHACTLHYRLGTVLYRGGDLVGSRSELVRALGMAELIDNGLTAAAIRYNLAQIALDTADPAEALRLLDDAAPVMESAGGPQKRFRTRVLRARALSMLGESQSARSVLSEANDIRLKLHLRERDAEYHLAAAQIQERAKEFEPAYRQMISLREAERDVALNAKDALEAELRARFDSDRRDRDYEVLVSKERAAQSRQWLLILGLASAGLFTLLLAFVIKLQRRQKNHLSVLAYKDELTGLPNRRSILELARRTHAYRVSSRPTMHVALIDIDHFKQVNDLYGHDVGDAVLREVAKAAGRALRGSDALGRYGGEEFLLVLADCRVEDLGMIFKRIRDAVHGIDIATIGLAKAVTFSMGVATADGKHALSEILKHADEALYRAKASGRDCMVHHELPCTPPPAGLGASVSTSMRNAGVADVLSACTGAGQHTHT